MAIPRIVYFAQSGTITTPAGNTYVFPVSSASCEETRPIEAVTSFGHFGSLNTAQTNLTTCKSTLKCYLGSGSGIGGGASPNGIDAAALLDLLTSTKASSGIVINVAPGGFTMTGIMTNIGIDISMGGFGMADFGFAGIGKPVITPPSTTYAGDPNSTMSISPITTMSIGRGNGTALSGTYASSIKFALDLPTDTLGALGDNPNAFQGSSQLISQMATKPPYKATVSVEGHGVDPTVLDTSIAGLAYVIGNIGITLPNAKVNARGFNNAAGQVSASFSYSAEDTSATFSAQALAPYSSNPANQTTPPAWGA